MGRIDLKTKDGILRLEYSNQECHSCQWCKIYLVTENEVTYLAAKPLEMLLSKLLTAFMEIQDREYVSYKGIPNVFVISNLEASHSTLLGKKTESGELELLFEETFGNIITLVTLTDEDKINWTETIFEHLIEIRDEVICLSLPGNGRLIVSYFIYLFHAGDEKVIESLRRHCNLEGFVVHGRNACKFAAEYAEEEEFYFGENLVGICTESLSSRGVIKMVILDYKGFYKIAKRYYTYYAKKNKRCKKEIMRLLRQLKKVLLKTKPKPRPSIRFSRELKSY